MTGVKQMAGRLANRVGIEKRRPPQVPGDIDQRTAETIEAVRPYTMTSPERIAALCEAVRYISRAGIPGAIVECGVWKGGSMMAAARTLIEQGYTGRDLYLFDTFEGMPPPRPEDGDVANALFDEHGSDWCRAGGAEVAFNMHSTGYETVRVHLVEGKVEDTIPGQAPEQIALLRLDTDWYESTAHELAHLFGRISSGGVLIIDDYGRWEGARRAVDEFLPTVQPLLLNRIDSTGRIAVIP